MFIAALFIIEYEATEMFIDNGVDKEDVMHTHKGILLSHGKNEHCHWQQHGRTSRLIAQ